MIPKPAEASFLVVFVPAAFESLEDLLIASRLASESTSDWAPSTPLAQLVAEAEHGWGKTSPWTAPPITTSTLSLLHLIQTSTGNIGPDLRLKAIAKGLAVLDMSTHLVFADQGIQARFENPQWIPQTSAESPDWLRVGALVRHSTFGEGRILDLGMYKGLSAVAMQFPQGQKVLDREIALRYLEPLVQRKKGWRRG